MGYEGAVCDEGWSSNSRSNTFHCGIIWADGCPLYYDS
ncbi:hypothetical protein CGLO_13706 [Colletotrichum gloeosporioides Cg-14]|uniref:Uncharacterized protein n=1 Tax=Colletotrichum gloeosporioides (strain Cg-14) TaxID=1237896 RepID=T0JVZ4_COLGC|nr:hypothetical protein CGLO_13706 [Colletotrichum gloeosporioides Cg-14]